MRMILAAALAVGLLATAPTASAVEDTRRCVTFGEFIRLPDNLTRRQVETQWEVVGLSTWDGDRSDPGHDVYIYKACGVRRDDTTVRVFYARHTRVWTLRIWNRHYS